MEFEEYKSIHTLSRLQVIAFTANGFLLDSCHTLIDLRENNSQSLFHILPFLKRYSHVYKDLNVGQSRRFDGIELDFSGRQYILDISFIKNEQSLVCVMEDVTRHYPSKSADLQLNVNGEDLNENLIEEIDQIKKIQQIRQDHFSKIAHDIKLPLTEIVGTTHLLKNYIADHKGLDYIKALGNSARNLDSMLNDLLSFSKSDAQKFNLSCHPFSVQEVINSAINTFEIKARKKDIQLKSVVPSNIPLVILGDSMRLWQILSNLVDNALKFTPKGEIKIELKTRNRTKDHILIEFNVIDSGIGIPQEKFNSIFETYSQIHNENAEQGYGIGLSIVKQLIELQEGGLSVKSKLGFGSTFTFLLKYALPEEKIA